MGQRFPIDKEHFRLGSDAGNELCIKGDDYVSGNHAYLSYQQGSLFLFDEGSRNGTFLNEQQVTGTPNVVRQGDRIRLGASVFEVTEMHSPTKNHLEEDEKVQQPPPRPLTHVD